MYNDSKVKIGGTFFSYDDFLPCTKEYQRQNGIPNVDLHRALDICGIKSKEEVFDENVQNALWNHVVETAVTLYGEDDVAWSSCPKIIVNNRLKRVAGSYVAKRRGLKITDDLIKISGIVFKYGRLTTLVDVLLHEMSHAILMRNYFTGASDGEYEFENLLKELGSTSSNIPYDEIPSHWYYDVKKTINSNSYTLTTSSVRKRKGERSLELCYLGYFNELEYKEKHTEISNKINEHNELIKKYLNEGEF